MGKTNSGVLKLQIVCNHFTGPPFILHSTNMQSTVSRSIMRGVSRHNSKMRKTVFLSLRSLKSLVVDISSQMVLWYHLERL